MPVYENKELDLQLYDLYIKAGRLDDAKSYLPTFQDILSKRRTGFS